MIRDDSLGVLATTYKGQCDGKGFIDCVTTSFKEISNILNQ